MQQLNELISDRHQLTRLADSMGIGESNIKKDHTFYIGDPNASNIQADREDQGNFLFNVIASTPRKWTSMKAKANAFKWETVLEHERNQGVFKFALPLTEDESSFLRKVLHLRQRAKARKT